MPEVLDTSVRAVREVVSTHAVFRRALAAGPQLVGGVQTWDRERAMVVASYYAHVLALVRMHADVEEQYLWTPLRARLSARSAAPAPAFADLAEHRGRVAQALAAAEDRLDEWAEEPSLYRGVPLAVALSGLHVPLGDHLDHEEAHLLPLARVQVSEAEWSALRDAALRSVPDAQPWLLVGLVQREMNPDQREHLLASVPGSVRRAWDDDGERRFTDFLARLGPGA